jgi:C-terminal processing protease CtpA/Prc
LPQSEPRLALQLAPADAGPGRIVARVAPLTTAAIVGLRQGDRIVRFGEHDIKPETDLAGLILRSSSPVNIYFERAGTDKRHRVQVPLAGKPIRIGINWREDPAEPGVVAINLLESGSPADTAGLKLNDRILQINDQDFANSEECRGLLLKSQSPVLLLIEREGQFKKLMLNIPEDLAAK